MGRMNSKPTLPTRVLVVGATGALGRPVVRLLRERGVAVRALSRRPDRAADLLALGAEPVAGDLADPATLTTVCDGITHVLACAHGLLGRGRQRMERVDDAGHRALIAAAVQAGVRRFVYTSAYGARADSPVDFFRTKHAIEQAVWASGLDAVVLRPTAFMEHHVHAFNGKGLLDSGKARLIGPGTKPRNFICAADLAQMAVRALLDEVPPVRTLAVGGPGHHSNLEVAALYAQLAGLPLKVSHLPAGLARGLSRLIRPWHPGVARILQLSTLSEQDLPEHFKPDVDCEALFGLRLTTVEDFVRDRVQEARHAPPGTR